MLFFENWPTATEVMTENYFCFNKCLLINSLVIALHFMAKVTRTFLRDISVSIQRIVFLVTFWSLWRGKHNTCNDKCIRIFHFHYERLRRDGQDKRFIFIQQTDVFCEWNNWLSVVISQSADQAFVCSHLLPCPKCVVTELFCKISHCRTVLTKGNLHSSWKRFLFLFLTKLKTAAFSNLKPRVPERVRAIRKTSTSQLRMTCDQKFVIKIRTPVEYEKV